MEELLAQVLLTGASLAAGFATRSRRLSFAAVGSSLAFMYVAIADSFGEARWGWMVLLLNLSAALFVLGYQRGIESRANSASLM